MQEFIPPSEIKIKTLQSELDKIFQHVSKKHNVDINQINITREYDGFYIQSVKYDGLSGQDEYKLLEIIEH